MTFCGDGGIAVTNDQALAEKISMLRNHGRKDKFTHELFGFNMRANEIQAAIGLVQLKHLEAFSKSRQHTARMYEKFLENLPIALPENKKYVGHVYHLYVIRVEERERLIKYLKEQGVCVGVHYPIPCHQQPVVMKTFGQSFLPRTENYCEKILSLPIYPSISEKQVRYVAETLSKAISV